MRDLRRRALLTLAGALLYVVGGLSNEAAGGLAPSGRYDSATVIIAVFGIALAFAGMVLAAIGIFGPKRERQ